MSRLSRFVYKRYLIFGILFLAFVGIGLYVHHRKSSHALPESTVSQATNSGNAVTLATATPASTQTKASTCPTGYVLVPANAAYHTTDFCVMKYEAKCAHIASPTIGIQPKKGEPGYDPEGVYKNGATGSACITANGRVVVSTSSGSPITYIPGDDASTDNATKYCDGILAHLITNDEWMTIARNVEQVQANWCSRNGTDCDNKPGTTGKILANGYNDLHNEPSASAGGIGALIASSDDSLACFGTTTDGTNTCGSKYSQKRTLALSNGQIIWDLAGNVWEWTATTTALMDEPASATKGVVDTGWTTSDFAPGASASVLIDSGKGPTLGSDAFRPSNPAWNAIQGIGRVYHNSSKPTDTTVYDFLRGGNWRHGSDDGVYTLHLSPPLNRAGIDDVGFRCVMPAS